MLCSSIDLDDVFLILQLAVDFRLQLDVDGKHAFVLVV